MDFSEKWGTDIDEAVKLALADLKLTIDEVDVTVLEEPSRGFFGIGSKLAKVRVEPKKKAEPVKKEETKKEIKKEVKQEAVKEVKKPVIKEKFEVTQRPDNLVDIEDCEALTFLRNVAEQMNLKLDIKAQGNDDSLYLDITGNDSGTIIGKRGQTLDSLQLLANNAVHKNFETYYKVKIDTENYRVRRKETLDNLAKNIAYKVKRTKRPVALEPMNPFERRVIHSALQNDRYVTTHSEGEDPYRHVVVTLKK